MFTNIKECQKMIESKSDDVQIQTYDCTIVDENISNLEFEQSFGCKYISDEFTFLFFAYEFSNDDLAIEYFENVTGKKGDPNPTFLDSSGMSKFNRIVVKGNRAYTVRCKKKDKERVLEFLNSCFSEKVR